MKIAVLKEGFLDCEKDVIETIKSAIKIFEKCGASTTEVSIPQHKTSMEAKEYLPIVTYFIGTKFILTCIA